MEIDLDRKLAITVYQAFQLILICVCLGVGITLLNEMLGFVVLGLSILIIGLPIFLKIFGDKND